MNKAQEKKVIELINKGKRFIGSYSGYITSLSGDNIKEAIIYFCNHYNATLSWIYDAETSLIYTGKLNNKPDERGRYNYSYFESKSNDLVFNEDELTAPIVKLKPVKNDGTVEHAWVDRKGRIFKCGFEAHIRLADELFLSNTVYKPERYKEIRQNDEILNKLGWLKISSKRITFTIRKLSVSQKKFIEKYIDVTGNENYEFRYVRMSKSEILKALERF